MSELGLEVVVTGPWKQNCYLISEPGGATLIVDPGDNFLEINTAIRQGKLEPIAIVLTHGHHDHVGAVPELVSNFDIPWFVHSADVSTLERVNFYRAMIDKSGPITLPDGRQSIDQITTEISVGDTELEYFHLPGHTPGSVCYRLGQLLFSGDTLFTEDIGRTDLPGGDPNSLRESLRFFFGLSGVHNLYPGHGGFDDLYHVLASNHRLIGFLNDDPT